MERRSTSASQSSSRKKKSHALETQRLADPLIARKELIQRSKVGYLESEAYLEAAIAEWMPAPSHINESDFASQYFDLLTMLAALVAQNHQDRWLQDLLARPNGQSAKLGMRELSYTIRAHRSGNTDLLKLHASRARSFFQNSHNQAGLLRVMFEDLYVYQLLSDYAKCRHSAGLLLQHLIGKQYYWIEAQAHLEAGICANASGDFIEANREVNEALEVARDHRYLTLTLRVMGIHAFELYDRGAVTESIVESMEGLREYWDRWALPERAYQLYWNLFAIAESRAQWQFAWLLGQEALASIAQTRYRIFEALARYRVALVAEKAGQLQTARQELAKAERVLGSPTNIQEKMYLTDLRIATAEVELNSGNLARANEILQRAHGELIHVSHYAVKIHYYVTLGRTQLNLGRYQQADTALRSALRIGARQSSALKSAEQRLAWRRSAAPAYKFLVESLLLQGDESAAFRKWEEYRRGAFGWSSTTGLSRHAIALKATSKTTFLGYGLMPEGLVIWIVDSHSMRVIWRPGPVREIRDSASHFRELCATPLSSLSEISKESRKLYRILIKPIKSYIAHSVALVIEADDALASIAFSALEDEAGSPLVDRYLISYTPYFNPLLNALNQPSLAPADRILIVTQNPGSRPFPVHPVLNAAAEEDRVAAHFKEAAVLIETKKNLMLAKRKIRSVDVFHFIGHGEEAAEQSELVRPLTGTAAQPNRGTASRRLQLKLAVFSACSTGTAAVDGLFESNGVVSSFLSAGVSNVIATKWSLDSTLAFNFMGSFYDLAVSQESVSDALQKTMIRMRSVPGYEHPYYWASYSLFSSK